MEFFIWIFWFFFFLQVELKLLLSQWWQDFSPLCSNSSTFLVSSGWKKPRVSKSPWDEEKEPNKDTTGNSECCKLFFFSSQWNYQLKNYLLMGIIWINLLNKHWCFGMCSKIRSIPHTFGMCWPASGTTEIQDFWEVPHFRVRLDLSISLQGTGSTRNPTGKHFPFGKSIMAPRAEGPQRHLNIPTFSLNYFVNLLNFLPLYLNPRAVIQKLFQIINS